MRILQLCNKPPYPTVDGGTIAMNALTQGLLQAGHTVKVVAIETPKHPFDRTQATEGYISQTGTETVFIDTTINPFSMLSAFVGGRLYILERFISKQMEALLEKVLRQHNYDMVLLESLYVAPYIDVIRRTSKAKIILRAHNVEHLLWQREYDKTQNPIRMVYLKQMIRLLKRYEQQAFAKVDGVAAISPIDAKIIAQMAPAAKVEVIPITTTIKADTGVAQLPNSVFHLGAMDWFPNIDGIQWLLDKVWPQVVARNANAKLYLAGRNMPGAVFNHANENTLVEGTVDNPIAFMADKQIMVVPLFLGSGVRVKIIEGMALGKAIVATPLAVEGLVVSHKNNIYIAGNAGQFAQAILDLLNNPALVQELGANAAAYVDANHRPAVAVERLVGLLNKA